jgi:hypothetical protein
MLFGGKIELGAVHIYLELFDRSSPATPPPSPSLNLVAVVLDDTIRIVYLIDDSRFEVLVACHRPLWKSARVSAGKAY